MSPESKAPEEMSFEEALDELEALTAAMASGSATLRESVAGYERGAALLAHCRAELDAARETVSRLEAGLRRSDEARKGEEEMD